MSNAISKYSEISRSERANSATMERMRTTTKRPASPPVGDWDKFIDGTTPLRDAAEFAGINFSTLSDLRSGRTVPTNAHLTRLARAFGKPKLEILDVLTKKVHAAIELTRAEAS